MHRLGMGWWLKEFGANENERNLNNKINRRGFLAAFLLQCLDAIGAAEFRLNL
jgi:hypothetical protein